MLTDKTLLVTGGSLGIGLAVAERCARDGAAVIVAARNSRDLEDALGRLRAISPRNHRVYSLDVGDLTQVRAFAAWCREEFGTIDGLVNSAGIYGPIGKSTEVPLEEFARAIQVNLLGTVWMCGLFAPLLAGRPRKKIVNFSGGGAAGPFPRYSAYATSKVGIVRFTENLAAELADEQVDVNCVAPGFVITRLHRQTLEAGSERAGAGFFEGTRKQIADGGVPASLAAELTAFLLSSASDGITGKFISAPWDPWRETEFQERLRTDANFATLRRIDHKMFFGKS